MTRNVLDKYRDWETELIRKDVFANTFPYACLMLNWSGDFNIATLIRNANAFGCKQVYYQGRKHIDIRGSVGTHHYTSVEFLRSLSELIDLKKNFTFVGIECNVESVPLTDFNWPENPLMIFGEESKGLQPEILQMCDNVVHIPQYGSVRSLNVGTASGIVFNDFVNKYRGLHE